MKRITALLGLAALVLSTSAVNADTFTVDIDQTWSSLTTISVDFDLPADAESVKSISIDISHTFQSDLTFAVSGPGGTFDVFTPNGGGTDLGITGSGTPGDEATYTFVESGGDDWAAGAALGGGTYNANGWADGGAAAGWNVTIIDDFAGDGGSVTGVTIEFNSAAIPEPASALLLVGLGSAVAVRRRR